MKILFVNPYVRGATSNIPPLGLCYLSAMLKKNGYKDIYGVDLQYDKESKFEKLVPHIDLLGIRIISKAFPEVIRLAKKAKHLNPNIKIVLGGPHATLKLEECIAEPVIDFVISGDGDFPMLNLVNAINNGGDFSQIKGLTWRNNGKVVVKPKEWNTNLDVLPFPDRELFDVNRYKEYRFYHPFLPIIASRSCPYNCSNCMPSLREICGPFRFRSADNVISEMEEIVNKYHQKRVWFNDSDLTASRQWIEDFCTKLIDKKLNMIWGCDGRANTLDKHMMELMKKAGCITIHFGVESGNQEVVNKILRKGIDLKRVKEIIHEANIVKMRTHCWFMIGIPGETKEQMIETLNYAKSLDCNSLQFSPVIPHPGIDLQKMAEANGWVLPHKPEDLENPERISLFKTDQWDPDYIKYMADRWFKEFDDMGWIADRKLFVFRNMPKEVEWNFTQFVGREFLTFLKDYRIDHIKWIFKGIKLKTLSMLT